MPWMSITKPVALENTRVIKWSDFDALSVMLSKKNRQCLVIKSYISSNSNLELKEPIGRVETLQLTMEEGKSAKLIKDKGWKHME